MRDGASIGGRASQTRFTFRTRWRLLLWLWLAPAVGSLTVRAAGLVTHAGECTIQNWQVEEGLPHISVTSIAQTPDGYLWVGTFNGLARFDGVRFAVFNEVNSPALGGSAITQLQVDEAGSLWIVTFGGRLVRFAGGQFTVMWNEGARCLLGDDGGPAGGRRSLFLLDSHGDRWRIGNGRVMSRDVLGQGDAEPVPQFLFENSCLSWIARPDATSRSHHAARAVAVTEARQGTEVRLTVHSATTARGGGYWLAAGDDLYRLTGNKLSSPVTRLPSPVSEQLVLQEDGQGMLWAGMWGGGLYRLNADGSWCHLRAGAGLSDNQIVCLRRDREGSLWVGTGQGGLYRIRPRSFQMLAPERGPKVVMSVTQNREGRLWLAVNGGGVHEYVNGRIEPVNEPALLRQHLLAYSVLVDRRGALWAGLYGSAVLQWTAETAISHSLDDGSNRAITPRALFEDQAGAVWLGCSHGLLRYRDGRFRPYTTRDGLPGDTITALAEDRAGVLYVGTDMGLARLRSGRFEVFAGGDRLPDNHVAGLLVDEEDTLWIGTANGGLSRFRNGRFAAAGVRDGLPSDTIGTLLEDGRDNLWIGSNRGIIRVNRSALNDYLDGSRDSVPWRVFGLADGLATLDCTGGSQPASLRTADGRLWFSTIRGAAVVDPERLSVNHLPPPVVIEEAIVDDQVQALAPLNAAAQEPVPAASALVDPPGGRAVGTAQAGVTGATEHGPVEDTLQLIVRPQSHRVEFRFTGLSLMASEDVRFRYRLVPFDRDWVQAGVRRVAYYSGLPPGRYTFQVTACNPDGVWNQTGTALGVVVLPPWWLTWWFRGLLGLAVLALVFGWYEFRLIRLRREREAEGRFSRQLLASQESERRRIAAELHDGMGQDLLVIASQAQLSLAREENSAGAAARLREIADTAKRALQHTRRMAHTLRPGLLDELGLTKAIHASAEKAARASGLQIAVNLDEVDGLLPPDFETNLYRIVQETLNNVLKHSQASEARIALTRDAAMLRFTAEDNGRGFEAGRLGPGLPDSGFGLRQMSERVKMMDGRVEIRSQPGAGTRVTVEVPLPRSGLPL